jgi:hypothetical protein
VATKSTSAARIAAPAAEMSANSASRRSR